MTKVTKRPTGFLHHHYQGQTGPQDCFVELDCEDGELRADWNAEIGNAVPFSVWHNRKLRWAIPALRSSAADELLERIEPLAERILAGYRSEWDGSNHVGRFTQDADEATEAVADVCNQAFADDIGRVQVWEASAWYEGTGGVEAQAEELGITATTSDEALEAIGKRELATALAEHEVDALEGLEEHLAWVREELREAAEFEIEFGQLAAEFGVGVPEQDAHVDVRVYVGDDNEWHVGTGGVLDLLDEEWAPRTDEQAAQLRRAAEEV